MKFCPQSHPFAENTNRAGTWGDFTPAWSCCSYPWDYNLMDGFQGGRPNCPTTTCTTEDCTEYISCDDGSEQCGDYISQYKNSG